MLDAETRKKKDTIAMLLFEVDLYPLVNYFDTASNKLLDEKIRVLTEASEGKPWNEIEGFYDIFENLPKGENVIWD